MKDKLQVVYTNELDISILDKDFYLMLFSAIVDLKNKKTLSFVSEV